MVTLATVLTLPRKHRDPHDGMAVGCLMIVIIAMLSPAAMVLIGVTANQDWLVKLVFYPLTFAVGWAALGILVERDPQADASASRSKKRRATQEEQQSSST